MGAEELPPEFVASAEAAAFEVEAAQVRAWSRCAEYLQQIVNGSTLGILDSRSAALILRHEAAMRGHLLAMADQMSQQGEETRGALEEDGRIIDRLMKDLGEARAFVPQARDGANELREECAKLKAALAHEQAVAEGRGRALDCLLRDLKGARADLLGVRAEAEALRAERDAALAQLRAAPSGQGRGCVVIELGVRIR